MNPYLFLNIFLFFVFFVFDFVTAPAKTQSFAILLCSHPESSGQNAVLRSFASQCRLYISLSLFSVSRLFVSLLSVSSFCLFSLTLLCVSSLSLSLFFFSSIGLGDGAKSQQRRSNPFRSHIDNFFGCPKLSTAMFANAFQRFFLNDSHLFLKTVLEQS